MKRSEKPSLPSVPLSLPSSTDERRCHSLLSVSEIMDEERGRLHTVKDTHFIPFSFICQLIILMNPRDGGMRVSEPQLLYPSSNHHSMLWVIPSYYLPFHSFRSLINNFW